MHCQFPIHLRAGRPYKIQGLKEENIHIVISCAMTPCTPTNWWAYYLKMEAVCSSF
jgi:hypothetical protein